MRKTARATAAPAAWASGAIALASHVLPAGPIRERYRQEFQAELHGMSRRRQAAHALGVLWSAWSLRAAVGPTGRETGMTTPVRRRPLLCRLNLRHAWRVQSTEDGGRFRHCIRCGKDGSRGGHGPGDWFIPGV